MLATQPIHLGSHFFHFYAVLSIGNKIDRILVNQIELLLYNNNNNIYFLLAVLHKSLNNNKQNNLIAREGTSRKPYGCVHMDVGLPSCYY